MVEVPAGMKAWAGGDRAPADWDGGPCLRRDGSLRVPFDSSVWNYGHRLAPLTTGLDVVAYTPRATPTGDSASGDRGEVEALLEDAAATSYALGQPNEWGYRDLADGSFIPDNDPFNASGIIDRLCNRLRAALTPSTTPDPVEAQALPDVYALRQPIRDVVFAFCCTNWDAGAQHDLSEEVFAAILALAQPGSSDEVERLREALRPFAVIAASVLGEERRKDRHDSRPWVSRIDRTVITYGDLRRARTALSTPSHADGG